jgi:FtsP/CotA-like multicopper oxidase with cupredoxin domain
MATTPTYAWPYQTLADSPDGASLGEDLALGVEATVLAHKTAATPSSATIATSQTTTSSTYTNLTTPGPSVTVTTGTTALVTITARMRNSAVNLTRMSYDISGATAISADDTRSLEIESDGWMRASMTHRQTGLTAGSNTFKAEYRVAAGTGTFEDRQIIVIPL